MIAAFMVPQEPEKKPKYIECEAAYPLAKKICDAIDSEDFQRLNFGMRILDWIDDIPAADVRPVVWKSVREHTPKPGRYLTCRKSMTMPPSYYCSILSYADNLESIDEYDFEGENIPGWYEYDSEYGHYSCDNVEWYMPLPPMPPNCGAMMEEQT